MDVPVVAVIDTSREILELLQEILEDAGFGVVTAYSVDFKYNVPDLAVFFQTHQPQAVVYDIALPYEDNWCFFREHVLAPGYIPEACFVMTTTNKRVLESLVGPTNTLELIGRPFDLDQIVLAVQRAVTRCQPG